MKCYAMHVPKTKHHPVYPTSFIQAYATPKPKAIVLLM